MRLVTFGALAITNDDGAASDPPLQRRQLALLAILASAGQAGVTRDQLLALLWPEQDADRARHALDQALYLTRRVLGAEGIVSSPTSLVLDGRIVTSDVADFARALEGHDLEAAVAVYAGPFLDGVYVAEGAEFERWAEGRRRYFADVHVRALIELGATASAAGDFPRAVGYLRRAAASNPLSGTVAHALMTALAAAGDRAAALEVGARYATLVHEELDAVAETAIRRLMDQLRVGSGRSASTAARSPDAPSPSATPPVPPGQRLAIGRLEALLGDRYRILRELGSGGMATVFLARDLKHDRDVALKVLRPEVGALLGVERFLNEIRISARLDHPHILTLIDSGTADELIYFVLPYVSGESLRVRLDREQQLPIEDALSIAEQIASALDYAHRLGVVHRDIKPENILLRERDAVLTDFGIAVAVREAGGHRITETGFSPGTPQYMSPEQATGSRTLDGRSDIYSLAAVLFELLTGEAPHSGPTVQSVVAKLLTERPTRVRVLRPTVPVHVEAAVMRGLEKVRADRFASAGAFGEALGAAGGAPRPAPAILGSPGRRMRRLWLAAAALAVIGGASAFGWSIATKSRTIVPEYQQLTFSGDVVDETFSPDGKWFAYLKGGDSGGKLMVQEVAGGPAIEAASGLISGLSWSPDGAGILFTSGGNRESDRRTYFVSRLGGSPRLLTNYGGESRFSPDGTRLAQWSFNKKKILLTTVATGETTSIALAGPFAYVLQVEWSPSGKSLGFLSQAGGPPQTTVWAVNVDGSALRRVVASDTTMILRFQWSPTGDAIYYRVGGSTLWRMPYQPDAEKPGGPSRLVLDGLEVWRNFTISRDGTTLLYTRSVSASNLWLVTTAGTGRNAVPATKALTTGTSMKEYSRISPDGQRIAFNMHGKLFTMPLDGGTPEQITFDNVSAFDLAWSPDGGTLAFLSYDKTGHGTVSTVAATGGPVHVFGATAASAGGGLSWSPGRSILYAQPQNKNYTVLDPTSGQERTLVQNDVAGAVDAMGGAHYSPDGKRIAVEWSRGSKVGVWLLSLVDSTRVLLREGAVPIGWSPSGDAVYVRDIDYALDREKNKILAIPVNGGNAREVAVLPFQAEVLGVAMAPDARHLVCEVSERHSDVRLVKHFDAAVR